jgi:Tol biopolymer transport system component
MFRRLGPYELVELVGRGGMGEVWKARDTRLGRDVAIKLISGAVPARFEEEARAIAALAHPHICTLYDVGTEDHARYLVMEFVDGRPIRGPLPVREALRYAIQIADALAAAHRAGIVHRDLKPGNVLLGRNGVTLVDFGLAARVPAAPAPSSDTLPVTRDAVLHGTLHYMAPEQLEGRDGDARSDIFAFGLILYELLTGRRAFDGMSQAGVMAAVMHGQPAPLSSLAPDAPPALERVVRRALEKDPERRWQTMEAVKDALEWVADSLGSGAAALASGRGWWPYLGAAAALVITTALAMWVLQPAPRRERLQVEVSLPGELTLGFDSLIALSPSASSFVVTANRTLWLRSLEDGSLRALPGTTGAALPFWSPDGEWIGFFADGRLKKMRLPDGAPQEIAEAPNPRGGTWGHDGTIVFAPRALGTLLAVPASGGEPRAVTALDASRQEDQHSAPVFLPGGRTFLYHARSVLTDNSALAVASLDQPPQTPTRALVAADTGGWFAPGLGAREGYVLFLRRRNLLVQRFSAKSGEIAGEPTVLARRVRVMADAVANMSVAARGELVYVADDSRMNQPRWYSRDGTLLGTVGDLGEYVAARLSPDERRLATVRTDPVDYGRSVWLLDIDRNVDAQIGVAGDVDDPVWSPDGTRLVFAWHRPGEAPSNLYEVRPGQAGEPRALVPPGSIRWPLDWSADGRLVLYAQIDPVTKFDLWVVPADGSGPPQRVVRGPGKDNEARFSPDGRYIAYQTDEVQETRVYATPYPPAQRQIPISEGSGGEPRWRRDGRELYYVGGDSSLVAVPIAMDNGELRPGRPVRLFGGPGSPLRVWHFSPSADGSRFLVLTLSEGPQPTPVHFVAGWQ